MTVLLAQSSATTMLFLGGTVIIVFVLLRRASRQIKKTRRATPSSHLVRTSQNRSLAEGYRGEGSSARTAMADEATKQEVRLHELGRDLMGQIDSKMISLQHLIRDADRAANRLEAALGSIQTLGRMQPDQRPAESAADADPPAAAGLSSAVEALRELEQSIHNDMTPPETTQAEESTTNAPPMRIESASFEAFFEAEPSAAAPAEGEPAAAPDSRYQDIYTLADYGLEPLEIASRVGIAVGKVELILGLRDKR